MRIPGIYVEIRGDFSKFQQDMNALRAEVRTQGRGISDALNNAISPKQATDSINRLATNLALAGRAAQASKQDFSLISAQVKNLAATVGLSEKEFAGLQSRMLQFKVQTQADKVFGDIQRATGMTNKELAVLRTRMGDAAGAARTLAAEGKAASMGMGQLLGSFSGLFSGIALFFTARNLARDMLDTTSKIQGMEVALSAVLGSTRASREEMEWLRKTVKDLGLDLITTGEAYKLISASAVGTSISQDTVRDTFTSVSEAAVVLGLTSEDTRLVLLALSQMISKGTVYSEELRRQMGDRLPGAFSLAARAMGVTTGELSKMLQQGQVATDVFLPKFQMALHEVYGEGARSADLLVQAQNRVSTAWTNFLTLEPATRGLITDLLNGFAKAIELANELVGIMFYIPGRGAGGGSADSRVTAEGITQGELREAYIAADRAMKLMDKSGGDLLMRRLEPERWNYEQTYYATQPTQFEAKKIQEAKKAAEELARVYEGIAKDEYSRAQKANEAYRMLRDVDSGEVMQAQAVGRMEELTRAIKEQEEAVKERNKAWREGQVETVARTMEMAEVSAAVSQQMLEASNDYAAGWRQGMRDVVDNADSGFKMMRSLATQSADAMGKAFGDFFSELTADGVSTFEGIGKAAVNMLRSIANAFYQLLGQKLASSLLGAAGSYLTGGGYTAGSYEGLGTPAGYDAAGNWVGSGSGFASAGATGGIVLPNARGNVLVGPGISVLSGQVYDRPTYFGYDAQVRPFAKGGVLGEAGPEAVMPLTRGKDGRLGVKADGEAAPTVVQNFNLSPGVPEAVQREVRRLMPYVQAQTISALDERNQRGRRK